MSQTRTLQTDAAQEAMRRVFFLTDAAPFPPHDGRKVPVANYFWELERRGYTPEVLVAEKGSYKGGLESTLREVWSRLRPYGAYFSKEVLSMGDLKKLRNSGPTLLFVAPARLIGLAQAARTVNDDLRIVLLLNDAQWGMHLEALQYGLGFYPGGKRHDLAKGLLTPTTLLREMTAYRAADVVVLQTARELARLPWLRRRALLAPNAVAKPAISWNGMDSKTFAAQVNFTNRRATKLKPFLTRVWPKIHAADRSLRLELFGPGETMPEWAAQVPGLAYSGPVPDLDAFLSDKRAFLVPLEHATGISNTVLRGLAMDMPMVITESASLGVRTMVDPWPEQRIRIARGAEEFFRQTLAIHQEQTPSAPRQIGSWSGNLDAIFSRIDHKT